MIQAQIRYDPVNPSVERTLKAEAADVLISFQERVLVNVLSVLFGSGEMEGEPQYRVIVVTDEFLEGGAVPALCLPDEHRVIDAAILSLAI
jgi:hypothetical protein